jgi:hypothetical protein
MGLKQMIAKAMAGDEQVAAELAEKRPVKISGDAVKAYATLVRKWTGWNDASLVFGEPEVGTLASCNRKTKVIRANPERLLLNPNRVLLTVNPFRLRQEAVLTGALLHEASHARHSDWIPRNEIDFEAFKHSDGSDVTKAEFSLAKVMEEPRVEGIIAAEADRIGAEGLTWTMRAMAAHVVPMTELSADPDQAIMDLIGSWALRAGRQVALQFHVNHQPAGWVARFNALLHSALVDHLTANADDPVAAQGQATADASAILQWLHEMARGTGKISRNAGFYPDAAFESDSGTFMIDRAKAVLDVLFPETPPNQMPITPGACGAGEGEGGGEGVSELPGENDEAGSGGPTEGEDEGEPTEGESDAENGQSDSTVDTESDLSKVLNTIEQQSQVEGQSETDKQSKPSEGGQLGGRGSGAPIGGGWRSPTVAERAVKDNAEKFLRDMIEPSTSTRIRITDQPSSMIDGAALSAWKAGGQVKAPRFFQQVKRSVKPTPPVKIAVLVDVSSSMSVLQAPSALLSWALAAACLDLRNFAGGGVQIESTLIHWGDTARVIQRNGELLPGIRTVSCIDGTAAMNRAYELIDEQIPGFFDIKDEPENKLIVHFTDWQLAGGYSLQATSEWVGKGLASGSSMLSVVPANWTHRHAALQSILAQNPIQRGRTHLMQYNPNKPQEVWATAAKALGHMR